MSLSVPNNPPTVNPGVSQPVSSGTLFGAQIARTQVNQVKGIGQNNALGAGIPKQVSNVQVSVANAQAGATCTVTVLFRRDPTDKTFSGVNVFVKGYQGNGQLVQVASGADSPCKFVLNNTGETVSFTIQTYGNSGSAPLNQAPTSSGTLPKSTTGGFGSSTTNYYSVTNPPPAAGTPVVKFTASAQAAQLGNQSLVASVPANGLYLISGYLKLTQAASASSQIGPVGVIFTDPDGTAQTGSSLGGGIFSGMLIPGINSINGTVTSGGNANNSTSSNGTQSVIPYTFMAKAATAIQFTCQYASVGATSAQYEIEILLEGPF